MSVFQSDSVCINLIAGAAAPVAQRAGGLFDRLETNSHRINVLFQHLVEIREFFLEFRCGNLFPFAWIQIAFGAERQTVFHGNSEQLAFFIDDQGVRRHVDILLPGGQIADDSRGGVGTDG